MSTDKRRVLFHWSLASFLAVACVAAWAFAVRQAGADLLYAQAEYLVANEEQHLEKAGQKLPSSAAMADAAEGLIVQALALNPYHPFALVARARDLMRENRFDEAMDAARRADRIVTTPETLNQIGSILLRLGDNAEAQRRFAETLAISPANREALERLVSIAQTDRALERMLARLRDLNGAYLYFPNTAYFWAQYWREVAAATKLPLYYAAGRRASGLAFNRAVPRDYALFYDPNDMLQHYNYFMMGARGMKVPDTGEVFKPKPPVNANKIGLRK